MVSNASDDLPDPDTPVTTDIWLCGMSSEMFLRLWTRAPRIRMESCTEVFRQFQYSLEGVGILRSVCAAQRPAAGPFGGGIVIHRSDCRPGLATLARGAFSEAAPRRGAESNRTVKQRRSI